MNTLILINNQLAQILNRLEQDLKDGCIMYNYLLCERKCKFLDYNALQEYIITTEIKNITILKEICWRCDKIIDIWNIDFLKLPIRKLDKPFVYKNEEKQSFYSYSTEFNAIYLTNDRWVNYSDDERKQMFFDKYDFTNYSVPKIAQRCAEIINFLTASFPELIILFEQHKAFTQPLQDENRTLITIKQHIEEIDNRGWQYSFRTEEDHILFTGLLTAYFEHRYYTLPAETIKLKRGCKTKLAKAFREIIRDLGNKDKLIQENGFFEIVRKLNHFQNDDIYKAVTR